MKKIPVAVVGATGLVGQRLVELLFSHPFFCLSALCAGPDSVGKTYLEAVGNRRILEIPEEIASCVVLPPDPELLANSCSLVFCAVKLPEEKTRELEESFAKHELRVISLNSALRSLEDVPMVIPEINPSHLSVIPAQKRRLNVSRGFIVTKCNCALLSFVPLLTPLLIFKPKNIRVTTLQAVSGAGKTLSHSPELRGNILPYIAGEEKKCETEPLKIWGNVEEGSIRPLRRSKLKIRAQCFRVPIENGHFAAVSAEFETPPRKEQVIDLWEQFNEEVRLPLPSAPKKFIHYFEEEERPQPLFDLYSEHGMGIEAGRLRCDSSEVGFVGLSHNTLRGAAGGAVLLAELLKEKGYLD